MSNYFRRLCALFLSTFLFLTFSFSVFADDSENTGDADYKQKSNFFHWISKDSSVLSNIVGYSLGALCPETEDGYHRASSYQYTFESLLGDTYFRCICTECGEGFNAYETDLKQSYETQVSEMPATGYNSDGSFLIRPKLKWMLVFSFGQHNECPHFVPEETSFSNDFVDFANFTSSFDCKNWSFTTHCSSGKSEFCVTDVLAYFEPVVFPCDGYYSRIRSVVSDGFYIESKDLGKQVPFSKYSVAHNYGFRSGGDSVNITVFSFSDYRGDLSYLSAKYYSPIIKCVPLSSIDPSIDSSYNISTRPTSITGNYGIIGDDGKLIQVTGNTIINETNNTYYNPATGQTVPITNWSYDYTDRSYTVTTEEGDSYTITYGDENVTINEGDTVYNIYYIVNGSGSGGEDPPSSCAHDWAETARTAPTCTTPGEITYTCGLCGETKTEPIAATGHAWEEASRADPACTVPGWVKSICSKCGETKTDPLKATGHTWAVERTVQTAYDDEGNLTQQGYTLYKCSVCGEQYKDTDSTGPPGSPGDSGGEDSGDDKESIWDKLGKFLGALLGGIGDLLNAVLSKLLDALASLAGTLLEKLTGVVETVLNVFDELPKLFGGFLDLLGILFPFLPPEITLLLTFGVIAVVFAAIIKAIRS